MHDPGRTGMSSIDTVASLYRRALEIDKNHVNANKNLGKIYYRKKKYVEAAKHFTICNKFAPLDGVCLYDLAKCRMRQARWKDSEALLKRLLGKLDQSKQNEIIDLTMVNIEQAKKNLETAGRVVTGRRKNS